MGYRFFRYTKDDGSGNPIFYNRDGTQLAIMEKGTNLTTIEGGSVSGDDLILKANSIDTYPHIDLLGNTNVSHVFGAVTNFMTIGTSSATGHRLTAEGVHHFKEVTSNPATLGPTYTALYGKDDNTLHWIDGDNVEHVIAFV